MVRSDAKIPGLTLWVSGSMLSADNPWIGRDRTMHPRMLATANDCSGGTCPAVYDDDPDLLLDELVIVGTKPSPGIRTRLDDRIAPHETAAVIKREIVKEALRPRAEPVDPADFQAQFETFSYSAFRLETLQHYVGTGRDDQWIALLNASHRWGKTHQRVHVVIEPLNSAMQEELTAGYEGNVAAGEDIRIAPVAALDEWPDELPNHDFWLFDSSKLYVMHYEPDGAWTGAERIHDPEIIIDACRARDAAMHRAVSWRSYIASRPDLQRCLAQ